jgi:hypothetical protein
MHVYIYIYIYIHTFLHAHAHAQMSTHIHAPPPKKTRLGLRLRLRLGLRLRLRLRLTLTHACRSSKGKEFEKNQQKGIELLKRAVDLQKHLPSRCVCMYSCIYVRYLWWRVLHVCMYVVYVYVCLRCFTGHVLTCPAYMYT